MVEGEEGSGVAVRYGREKRGQEEENIKEKQLTTAAAVITDGSREVPTVPRLSRSCLSASGFYSH